MRYVLFFQGFYYLVTGLWSIISIESFSSFTKYQGDYFLKHTNGILFFTLGILFIYSVFKQELIKQIPFFAFLTALGVMVVEVYYLPKIGNPFPFWIDFGIEGVIVVSFLMLFAVKRRILK